MPADALIVEKDGEKQREMGNFHQRPQAAQAQSTSHAIIRKWQIMQGEQTGQTGTHSTDLVIE